LKTEPDRIQVARVDRSGIVDEQAGTTIGVDIALKNGEEKRLVIPTTAAPGAAVAVLVAHELALKLRREKGLPNPVEAQRIAIDGAEGVAFNASVLLSLRVTGGGALTFLLPPDFARTMASNIISCAEAAEEFARRQH